MNWAANRSIAGGTSATVFSPDKPVTRQEVAVFMANYAKAMGHTVPETREAIIFADNASIASSAAVAVKQMQMAGVINGKKGNRFDPHGIATRGEISAMLRRYIELVINVATAQGLDKNDSGSVIMYGDGKLVKSQTRTVNGSTYTFNAYGEAALSAGNNKYLTHTVKNNEYFYSISKLYGCTVEDILKLNELQQGVALYPGDILKIPQA